MTTRAFRFAALTAAALAGLSIQADGESAREPFVKLVGLDEIKVRGKFTESKDGANIRYLCNDTDYREPNEADALAFDFTAPADGKYYLWAYVWVFNDQADSLFVKVGAGHSTWVIEHPDPSIKPFIKGNWGDWVVWNHLGNKTHRTWLWWRVAGTTNPQTRGVHVPMGFRLTAGTHRIVMAGREASARIAQLLITDEAAFVPEGLAGKRRP